MEFFQKTKISKSKSLIKMFFVFKDFLYPLIPFHLNYHIKINFNPLPNKIITSIISVHN
jgi:hypothetical protein